MKNFEKQLAEILEVEAVRDTDELNAFDSWDSLTILSIIALVDENYGVPMTAEQIEETVTIGGLVNYVQGKRRIQAL
jgi:acyl carrier protein